MTISPQRAAALSLSGCSAGMPFRPAGERPRISRTIDIVLAVYCPPHAPAPGQLTDSISYSSSAVILPARYAPMASKMVTIVASRLPLYTPG